MNYPKFKVCVRSFTYNQSAYITDTMNGFVIQQTTYPFVCCIVDDASTDGEQKVIRKYFNENFNLEDKDTYYEQQTDYATILYAQHRTNLNCYFAIFFLKENLYSKGQSAKKFEYLAPFRQGCTYEALCEGDDYWIHPQKLQMQTDFLDNNKDYSMCSGGLKQLYKNDIIKEFLFKNKGQKGFTYTLDNYNNYAYSWTLTICYRKSCYPEKYSQKYKYPRDVVLIYELLKRGKGYFISEIFAVYRIHKGGIASMLSRQNTARIGFVIRKDMYKKDPCKYTKRYLRLSLYSLYIHGNLSNKMARKVIISAWKLSDTFSNKCMTIKCILGKVYYRLKTL